MTLATREMFAASMKFVITLTYHQVCVFKVHFCINFVLTKHRGGITLCWMSIDNLDTP